MEGQPFFNSVAGLGVSLAGFAALIAWLRDDPTAWDPINLWRVKTIVRHALTIAFISLATNPIYSLTGDAGATVRIASGVLVLLEIAEMVKVRHPDPAIWVPRSSWTYFMVLGGFHVGLQLLNLWWVSLGVLQIGYLIWLSSPAGIFYNFVRELGERRAVAEERSP